MKLQLFRDQQSLFLENLKEEGKTLNTIKSYKNDLHFFHKFLGEKGKTPLGDEVDFTTSLIQDYNRFLDKNYTSTNSKRRRLQAIRLFCDFLIKNELMNENPFKKLASSPKIIDIPRPVSFSDCQKCQTALKGFLGVDSKLQNLISQRNLVIFHLVYGSGLKVSEIAKLLKSDLQKDQKGNFRILLRPDKREPYTVPTSAPLQEYLPLYLQLLESYQEEIGVPFKNLLFNANQYRILSGSLGPRGLEILFEKWRKEFSLSSLTPKQLRQSAIFSWLSQDIPPSSIKEWLGLRPAYSLKPHQELLENQKDVYFHGELLL